MSSVTAARTDIWHCRACGGQADLAPLAAEVGLVRAAVLGAGGFTLGSSGVQDELAGLLTACECGGTFAPGAGEPGAPRVQRPAPAGERFRELAAAGWEELCSSPDPRLAGLVEVWRARALRALGRESELTADQQLELRLEDRMVGLLDERERAVAAGDPDSAETAHARYVELASTYARRFIGGSRPG